MPSKINSYADLVKQIASMQAEAERIRVKETTEVVARIREAIKVYGLSAADLGLAGAKRGPKPGRKAAAAGAAAAATNGSAAPAKRRRRRGAAKKSAAQVVKYSNGTGGTWGGIGKRPQWLRDAIAAGKQLSDFAVK
jgi:DNA-binding protein H-NS